MSPHAADVNLRGRLPLSQLACWGRQWVERNTGGALSTARRSIREGPPKSGTDGPDLPRAHGGACKSRERLGGHGHRRARVGVPDDDHGRATGAWTGERETGARQGSRILRGPLPQSAWPESSARGKAMSRATGPTVTGVRGVTPLNVRAWESLPMSAEHEKLEILSWGRRVR